MKRLYLLAVLALLSGCLVIESPNVPTPAPTQPALNVLEFNYFTNYRGSTTGASYICDNRPTVLTYRFRYEGGLERWTSYLRGQTLSQEKGVRTFDPRTEGVSPYESAGFEVNYAMGAYFAPYKQGEASVSPQAIEVVPVPQPVIIGATRLYLVLEGVNGQTEPRISGDIPVISNCP